MWSRLRRNLWWASLVIVGIALPVSLLRPPAKPATVAAAVETDPVPSRRDSADDPAIWIHPTDPARSTIIGTDKRGGVAVYDLTGKMLQFLPDGRINNVDLRYNFPLGGERVALVAGSNRTGNTIALYRVNPVTRKLENVAARPLEVSFRVYGSCMYHSPLTGSYYFFANSASGKVEQWELFDNGQGQVEGKAVRYFELESRTEGCVTDDVFARFYIGEEHVGVWRYGAEPEAGETRTLVDTTKRGGHLTEDVEGLTLYYTTRGDGYLLVSSQGNDTYVAYERGGKNAYVMTFEIVAGNGIDEVTHTDGIDVTNFGLGPAFLQGVFVAQDNKNEGANQNYKLVPWQTIANSTRPPLTIDTVWDPRQVGGSSPRRDD